MSAWTIHPYPNDDGGGREWDEYAVNSPEGPICTGVLSEAIAKDIAALPELKRKLQRSERDIHISQENTLELILAELRRLNSRLGTAALETRSSIEIRTSARGVDVSAKSYDYDCEGIASQVAKAVDAYFESIKQVMERAQNGGAPK